MLAVDDAGHCLAARNYQVIASVVCFHQPPQLWVLLQDAKIDIVGCKNDTIRESSLNCVDVMSYLFCPANRAWSLCSKEVVKKSLAVRFCDSNRINERDCAQQSRL